MKYSIIISALLITSSAWCSQEPQKEETIKEETIRVTLRRSGLSIRENLNEYFNAKNTQSKCDLTIYKDVEKKLNDDRKKARNKKNYIMMYAIRDLWQ